MSITLYGYRYSVYSWIARLAMAEKGVKYDWVEVDPFGPVVPHDYLSIHPFKRVPALVHDQFQIYETAALTRYIDEALPGPALQSSDPRTRARCNQIISVTDSYAYWPLVRQVFSHAIFRPRFEQPSDQAELQSGLAKAPRILDALEQLIAETPYLCGYTVTLADIHLAPVISYFTMAEPASMLLKQRLKLAAWVLTMAQRPSFAATMPHLPTKA